MVEQTVLTSSIERREGHFRGHQGLELFYQTWAASSDQRPTLVLTHGLSEHSECYARTASRLVELGWDVCAWDLRGHGRSEGKRGFVADFHDYALDLGYLLRALRTSGRLKMPFALFGHSMGGLITLHHLLDRDAPSEAETPRPNAIALSSPALGVAVEVPVVKDIAARVLIRVMPSLTLYNEIDYSALTRDPELLKTYGTDPLRHDKASPALYLGMLKAIDEVRAGADRIRLPALLQAAGADRVVSTPAIREFFPRLGSNDKKLIIYEGGYHEIYNDLDRDKVLQDLNAFLMAKLGANAAPKENA